ncbi:MAG: ABC transporter permease [Thermoanaerobaculaceae bacterium]
MGTIASDIRLALRNLARRPGFTLAAVLTLGLGIGAAVAVLCLVNAALLRRLPFPEAERLVVVREVQAKTGARWPASYPNFRDWQARAKLLDDLAALRLGRFNITGDDEPERVVGASVTANLLPLLGLTPAAGRLLTAAEETFGGNRVALLSHRLWQRRFGGKPDVVGRTATIDGVVTTVIGVMPPGVAFPPDCDLWLPLALPPQRAADRSDYFLFVIGRLRPDVTVDSARAEISSIAGTLARDHAEQMAGWGATVLTLRDVLVGQARPAIFALLAATGLILLIGCSSVASMLLMRALAAEPSHAVRLALGAGHLHLVRGVFTETILLGLLGGVAGSGVAVLLIESLTRAMPAIAVLGGLRLDGVAVLLTLVVSLATGLALGLAPALRAARPRLSGVLRSGSAPIAGGRSGSRPLTVLVIAEVALALVLLVGAGLLLRSLEGLARVEPGFDPDRVLALQIGLPRSTYSSGLQQSEFYRQLVDGVRQLPGVVAAGAVSELPMGGGGKHLAAVEGRPLPPPEEKEAFEVGWHVATPGYLESLRVRLSRGRSFTERDGEGSEPVAIVSETMAKRHWPGEDPIGKRVAVRTGVDTQGPWLRVVGVTGDLHYDGLTVAPSADVFVPHRQSPWPIMHLTVRTAGEPTSVLAGVRARLRALDPNLPVWSVRTMEELVDGSFRPLRQLSSLVGAFAGVALLLAAMGLYGTISFWVVRSTHELGVRLAIGARAGEIRALVVGRGLRLTTIGLAIGLAGAITASTGLERLLFGVTPTDPVTYFGVGAVLVAVAALASLLAARHATRIDPIVALRCE